MTKQYFSKVIYADDVEALDVWLNSLALPGYGTSIAGYAPTSIYPSEMERARPAIIVTVKRWPLVAPQMRPFGGVQPYKPSTIDETFEEPSVQVGDDSKACPICGAFPGEDHDGEAHDNAL